MNPVSTSPQSPPPLRPPPLLPASPESGIAALLSWIVIAASVALMFGANYFRKSTPPEEAKGPDPQQLVAVRYAVGANSLLSKLSPEAAKETAGQLTRDLREKAKSGADQLYAAIATAAIDDRSIAREKLKLLARDDDEQIRRDAETVISLIDGAPVDEESRQQLIERHHWIGRLAAALDRPANDAQRLAMESSARRSAVAIAILLCAIVLAVFLGLALLVTALVLLSIGRLRFAPTHPAGRSTLLLEGFAVYLALLALSITLNTMNFRGGPALGAALILASFAMGLTWPLLRGMPPGDFAAAIGFKPLGSIVVEAFWGVVGYVALLPLMVIGFFATILLQHFFGADAAHPIKDMFTGPLSLFIFVAIMATVFAPVTEELLFRGAFFGYMRTKIRWVAAAVVVGVIFAAIHPQGWAGIPLLATIGFNLAVLRQWRSSIVAPIVAHAFNNGTVVLLVGLMLR